MSSEHQHRSPLDYESKAPRASTAKPTDVTSLAFGLLAIGLLACLVVVPRLLPHLFRGQLSMVPLFGCSVLGAAVCAIVGMIVGLAKGIRRSWANALGFAVSAAVLLFMCIMRAIH